MAIEVRKREGESANSLLYRFMRRTQQSGILREAKKRRFRKRVPNRSERQRSALHRVAKAKEIAHGKKWGIL